MNVIIRDLKESDISAVAEMLHAMWMDHAERAKKLLKYDYIKNYDVESYCRRSIKDPKQQMLVAVTGSKVIGVARAEIEEMTEGMYKNKKVMYFDDLIIHPDWRHQGVASKLLKAREELAKRKAIKACYSKVYTFNKAAQELLEKNGFEDIYRYYYKFLD